MAALEGSGPPDSLLTPKEAAAFLQVPEATVRRLIVRGELPAAKIGKRWRLRLGSVARWKEERYGHVSGAAPA